MKICAPKARTNPAPRNKIQTNPAVPILGCVDDPWAFHPGLEQD